MRLLNLFTLAASLGAAAADITGTFEIVAEPLEGDAWATSLETVSHGANILSLSIEGTQQFTWNNATSRLVPVGQEYLHSSVGEIGYTLLFVTDAGPDDPSQVDGPLALLQVEGEVYLVTPDNHSEKFQWNTVFREDVLPTGFGRAAPGDVAANAALRVVPTA